MERIRPSEPYDFRRSCSWYPVKPFPCQAIITKAESISLAKVFSASHSPWSFVVNQVPVSETFLATTVKYGTLTLPVQLAVPVDRGGSSAI